MKILAFMAVLASAGSGLAQEKPAGFEAGGLKFSVPKEWQAEEPSSRMRKAQYKAGEAEVVVFYFGKGQGGGVDANVARWLGQFKEPREKLESTTEKRELPGGAVTTVTAKGTYLSGPPFGAKVPKPGFALRGAIVVAKGEQVFVKMTGPLADVEAAAMAFDAVLDSALKE